MQMYPILSATNFRVSFNILIGIEGTETGVILMQENRVVADHLKKFNKEHNS